MKFRHVVINHFLIILFDYKPENSATLPFDGASPLNTKPGKQDSVCTVYNDKE